MVPIQLWLPALQGGAHRDDFQRDFARAFEAWERDHVVWMIPGWDGPKQWGERGLRVCAINAEHFEQCRILHIGQNLRAVGPAAVSFPNCSVSGLLTAWLRDEVAYCFTSTKGDASGREIKFSCPAVTSDGQVCYVNENLQTVRSSQLPIVGTHDDSRSVKTAWPGISGGPKPVSPEIESFFSVNDDPEKAVPVELRWGPPFNLAMPIVSSLDDLHARDVMRDVVQTSTEDMRAAMRAALARSRPWLSDGYSTVNLAWLQPIVAEEGEGGALFALESKYGFVESSLVKAYESEECRRILDAPVKIRRAWGVPGLMWALLIDRYEAGIGFRACQRCGKIMYGRTNASTCSARDNPDCRRGYDRERKRKQRSGKR